jgi:hypothetical protein
VDVAVDECSVGSPRLHGEIAHALDHDGIIGIESTPQRAMDRVARLGGVLVPCHPQRESLGEVDRLERDRIESHQHRMCDRLDEPVLQSCRDPEAVPFDRERQFGEHDAVPAPLDPPAEGAQRRDHDGARAGESDRPRDRGRRRDGDLGQRAERFRICVRGRGEQPVEVGVGGLDAEGGGLRRHRGREQIRHRYRDDRPAVAVGRIAGQCGAGRAGGHDGSTGRHRRHLYHVARVGPSRPTRPAEIGRRRSPSDFRSSTLPDACMMVA